MGLMGKYTTVAPAKKPSDDTLLIFAILAMAAADGELDEREDEITRGYANTLPEFRDMDGEQYQAVVDSALEIAGKYATIKESLPVLEQIESEAIRKKAFVLAADIAMSSGEVDSAEDELLTEMQKILKIEDALAERIVEVIALKYAT